MLSCFKQFIPSSIFPFLGGVIELAHILYLDIFNERRQSRSHELFLYKQPTLFSIECTFLHLRYVIKANMLLKLLTKHLNHIFYLIKKIKHSNIFSYDFEKSSLTKLFYRLERLQNTFSISRTWKEN